MEIEGHVRDGTSSFQAWFKESNWWSSPSREKKEHIQWVTKNQISMNILPLTVVCLVSNFSERKSTAFSYKQTQAFYLMEYKLSWLLGISSMSCACFRMNTVHTSSLKHIWSQYMVQRIYSWGKKVTKKKKNLLKH